MMIVRSVYKRFIALVPGVTLCAAVSALAVALQSLQEVVLGRAWLEALVLAILIGTAVRTAWRPGAVWSAGIAFSAKMLLEIAVFLLGASISIQVLVAAGPGLIVGIFAVVTVALAASYGLCRALKLPPRMAILIACGNSICGNSAIAAVASVIDADGKDVASSIAFTAILGVIVVLALPIAMPALGLSLSQYGVLAGLTVYAVPQVLAATIPVGALSTQLGTLVKLIRVLMLGPIVLFLGVLNRSADAGAMPMVKSSPFLLHRLVPWFIIGFLLLAALRSAGAIPMIALPPIAAATSFLTIIAMAALGLGVDIKVLGTVGGRVTAAVSASLAVLFFISLVLIHALKVS